jgi:hypothetical protein
MITRPPGSDIEPSNRTSSYGCNSCFVIWEVLDSNLSPEMNDRLFVFFLKKKRLDTSSKYFPFVFHFAIYYHPVIRHSAVDAAFLNISIYQRNKDVCLLQYQAVCIAVTLCVCFPEETGCVLSWVTACLH